MCNRVEGGGEKGILHLPGTVIFVFGIHIGPMSCNAQRMIFFAESNMATNASSEGRAFFNIVPYLPIVITGTNSE